MLFVLRKCSNRHALFFNPEKPSVLLFRSRNARLIDKNQIIIMFGDIERNIIQVYFFIQI